MKLLILAVGRLRSPFYRQAFEDYGRRLVHYTRFESVEVKGVKLPPKESAATRKSILAREAERLLARIPAGARTVALAEEGRTLDSAGLADLVGRERGGVLVFVVGGSLGLHDDLKKRADLLLSLSRMTLPHELARLVLAEQLYRAFTILRGEPYHN